MIFPVGVYYASRFLGNHINDQKDKIAYVPLKLVADYVYIADLILDTLLAGKRYLTKFLN